MWQAINGTIKIYITKINFGVKERKNKRTNFFRVSFVDKYSISNQISLLLLKKMHFCIKRLQCQSLKVSRKLPLHDIILRAPSCISSKYLPPMQEIVHVKYVLYMFYIWKMCTHYH